MRPSSVRNTLPGMRVGVDEAVHQDLLQVGTEQLVGQDRAVELGAHERD